MPRRASLTTTSGVGFVLLTVGAVIGLLLGVAMLIFHLTLDPLADVRAYYDAGARLNAGLPLYVDVANTNVPGSYHYPPLLAIAFRPLALLPYEVAAIIWEAVIIGATVLTFARLGLRRPVLLAAGFLGIAFAWTLAIGQAQALITLCLAIGSPFAVAVAANLKVYPILVAVYWVGRRDWRQLGRLAVWMVALIGLQFVLEPADTLAYLGFLSVEEVSGANNLSLFALSPPLWFVSVVVLGLVALKLAPTRWGWAAAVVLSVFATPRLLSYQLSTLIAAFGGPEMGKAAEADGAAPAKGAGTTTAGRPATVDQ